ncbi:MAG: hypothetical protein KBT04_04890, partial [Bacteroidales bacterium]|nr:hypothetical protein [Candidatus Colimorpha onthohippi]
MKSRILSVIMLLLAVSTLAACHNGQSDDVSLINNPNSALGYDSTASVPHMVFDCNMHDFGRLTPGESLSYSFHFVNKGTADLII